MHEQADRSTERILGRAALFSLAFLVALGCFCAAGAEPAKLIAATRLDDAPDLDGWLDEEFWSSIPVATGFVQQRPEAGAPSTANTRVRVVYTSSALYVAFECDEPDPRGVLARSLGRDPDLTDEDSFTFVLDTFDDDQNGFVFIVNPTGARTDLLVRSEGEYTNLDWDGIWSAWTRITENGWQGEVEIPWRTLRFPSVGEGESIDMGINFERQRRHVNEQSQWSPVPRQYDLDRVSLAGALRGLRGISPGRNVVVRPYVLQRIERGNVGDREGFDNGEWEGEFELGADVKMSLTSSLTLDLTVNTDFAQVEVDDEEVNLTRFPLFYPEKREFFLEKANLFRFGSPTNVVFYSRSVGLDDFGRTIPIRYGGRITGKIGTTEVGALFLEQEDAYGLPTRRAAVGRIQQDVGTRSTIGFLASQRSSGDDGRIEEGTNRTFGFDADLFPTDNSIVRVYGAKSDEDGRGTDDGSWSVRTRWAESLWSITYLHESIGVDYAPALGFVPRRGVETDAFELAITPEPNRGGVRQVEGYLGGFWSDRRFGPFETRYLYTTLGVVGTGGERLALDLERSYDRILAGEEFPIGDLFFGAEEYTYDTVTLSGSTDPSRWWTLEGSIARGKLFDADQRVDRLGITVRSVPHFTVGLEMEYATLDRFVDSVYEEFESELVRLRLAYDHSNALSVDLFTQYNAAADLVLSQLRAHWIFGDESDLYFVIGDARDDRRLRFTPTRRSDVTVKLGYAIQL